MTTWTRPSPRNRHVPVNTCIHSPATSTSSDLQVGGCDVTPFMGASSVSSDWLGHDSMPPPAPAVLTRRVGGVTGLRGSRRCGGFRCIEHSDRPTETDRQTDRQIHTERHKDTCARTETRPCSTGGRGYAPAQRTCMRVKTQHRVRCLVWCASNKLNHDSRAYMHACLHPASRWLPLEHECSAVDPLHRIQVEFMVQFITRSRAQTSEAPFRTAPLPPCAYGNASFRCQRRQHRSHFHRSPQPPEQG